MCFLKYIISSSFHTVESGYLRNQFSRENYSINALNRIMLSFCIEFMKPELEECIDFYETI